MQQRMIDSSLDDGKESAARGGPETSVGVQSCVRKKGLSANQIKAIQRQLRGQVRSEVFSGRPSLVPVAVPNSPAYLKMAAEAILEFNSKGRTGQGALRPGD